MNDSRRNLRRLGNQRGIALLMAVIMLVVLTLAGIALVRSVDTATIIGGNFASRQAAIQGSDLGVEAALAALPSYVATPDTTVANQYYATMLCQCTATPCQCTGTPYLDTNGIPQGINWSSAPSTTAGSYTVQYVIERMCANGASLPITNVPANCITDPAVGGGSNAMGESIFVSNAAVYYRITLRTSGPRNTATYVQATVAM